MVRSQISQQNFKIWSISGLNNGQICRRHNLHRIIFGGYCDWFIGVLAIHSAITVSYVRARAESQELNVSGIAERAVRMITANDRSSYRIFNKRVYFTYTIIILVILSTLQWAKNISRGTT